MVAVDLNSFLSSCNVLLLERRHDENGENKEDEDTSCNTTVKFFPLRLKSLFKTNPENIMVKA